MLVLRVAEGVDRVKNEGTKMARDKGDRERYDNLETLQEYYLFNKEGSG